MFLFVAISVGVTLVIWGLIQGHFLSRRYSLVLMVAATAVVLLAARPVQTAILSGYPNDSFWDLGLGGRLGVLAISAFGLALIFLILAWKSRFFRGLPFGLGLALDVLVGILIYAVLYSVSPQAYYALYQMIFPDLPTQIVVRHIISPRLVDIAQLQAAGSMSDHLAGVALWAILPFTLWVHSLKSRA